MAIAWKNRSWQQIVCALHKVNSSNSNLIKLFFPNESFFRYEIMLSCWRFDPQSRPLFDDLEKCLTKLMENEVAERYVRLNEPYFRLNLTNPRADYLSMLASPPCTVTSTSPYENIDISASSLPTASELQSNYMPMFPIKGKHASQYVNVGTQTSWTEWNNPL